MQVVTNHIKLHHTLINVGVHKAACVTHACNHSWSHHIIL